MRVFVVGCAAWAAVSIYVAVCIYRHTYDCVRSLYGGMYAYVCRRYCVLLYRLVCVCLRVGVCVSVKDHVFQCFYMCI